MIARKQISLSWVASGGQTAWRQGRQWCQAHPDYVFSGKCMLLFSLFWLVGWERLDPDFGWHLQAGNYFRAHGIPAHDIYTYTARSFTWIDHEWGSDVILSLIYGWGGYSLLAAFYALIWSGALMITAARARLFVLITAAIALLPYAGVRPIAWSVLNLAICLRLLNSKDRRWRWALIPLFIVWANLHGGFVIGLLAVVFYAIVKRDVQLLGFFVLCMLATLANVYGPRLYVELGRTFSDSEIHKQIAEWMPFLILPASRPFLFLWGAGTVIFLGRKWKQYIRFSMVLLLGVISASRNMPLFVIAATPELNNYFERGRKRIPKQLDARRQILIWAICIYVVGAVAIGAYSNLWPISGNREEIYPTHAVAYLQQHGCEGGNIFNDYNYGGYLIWKLSGRPVYIDGRMPSWRAPDGEKYLDRFYGLLHHPGTYPAVFKQYNIRCVLLQHIKINQKLLSRLKRDHWQPMVISNHSSLLLAPTK